MKKQIAIIALSAAGLGSAFGAAIEGLSASTTVAFESNYVFRGGQQYSDNMAIQPGVDVSMPAFDGSAYVGYWGSYGYGNGGAAFSESDYYIGYGQDLTDYMAIDGGYTYYGLENTAGATDRWKELYLGLSFDGLFGEGYPELSPSIYAYYNISGEAWTFEGSIGHSFSLEDITPDLGLDLGAYLGAVDFDDANGDQAAGKTHDGYTYYGATADLVYTVNDVASVSLGVRYAGNNNNQKNSAGNLYLFDTTEDMLWWGVSTTFGF